MGRVLLVWRLAMRDLTRHRTETALLLLAITAATTALTLGLVLRDAAADPYASTRQATNGPDVVVIVGPFPAERASEPPDGVLDQPADLSGLEEMASAPGVVAHSGPFPVTRAELEASGRTADVQAIGRDAAPASVDQPELIRGTWVRDGGVVVEAAVASLSVLVGGRMADQTRRVGLLKAAGATPSLVAAVLLAEYVLVAIAAAAGLAPGSSIAPSLTGSSAGLVASTDTPSITISTIGVVAAVALGVAAIATFVPAVRAARTSTVHALADAARPPGRTGWLIAISARLPVALLVAVRIVSRRPRRVVLSVVGIAITVSGVYVALVLDDYLTSHRPAGGLDNPQTEPLRQVLVVVMVMVLALAAVNTVFVTWATVIDNRHSTALTRALGATPGEVSSALAAAQVLPALAGAIVGIFPGGIALLAAINAITGGDSGKATLPPLWQLIAVVLATVLAVTALTAIPARLGSRQPVAEILRSELA